jgi:hypothetical protein
MIKHCLRNKIIKSSLNFFIFKILNKWLLWTFEKLKLEFILKSPFEMDFVFKFFVHNEFQ